MVDRSALLRAGSYAWALIGLAGVAVLAWLVLSHLAVVTVPLLLAVFPAAVLAPAVSWLVDHRVPRAVAALVVLTGLLVVVAGVVAAIVPSFVTQLPKLVDQIARGIDQLRPLVHRLPGVDRGTSLSDLVQRAFGGDVTGMTVTVTRDLLTVLVALVLLIVTLFFYLYQGRSIVGWLLRCVPRRRRDLASELAVDVWHTLGRFFRTLLFVALVDGVLIGAGLALLGVPLALPLAVLVFIGAFLPYIGATLSGLVAILVAFADGGLNLALAVLVLVVVVQQLEGNVLQPLAMGHMVRLPAFAVIVAITAGMALLGVLGAFLAVPVVAALTRIGGALRERQG